MTDRFGPASIDYRYNKVLGVPLVTLGGCPLTVSGTSARSSAAMAGNSAYEFYATTDMYVSFAGGATDDATSANMRVGAGERLVYTTPAGTSYYVAALQVSSGGELHVWELSQDRIY